MGNVQYYYITKDESVTAGAVGSYSLPRTAPIVGLLLTWDITTTATTGSAAAADDVVIEVIRNGSEVITSATYGELVAVNQLLGYRMYPIADLGAGVTGSYRVFVPFGFGANDRKHFLDPSGFSALDLKVTQPSGDTGSMVLNVVALRLWGGGYTSGGYIKVSTKKVYTAASAVEYIELDRANQYAAIVLGEMDGVSTNIQSVVTKIKLNVDAGINIPVDIDSAELIELAALQLYPRQSGYIGSVDIYTNFIPLLFGAPWTDESGLLPANTYGSLVVEATGVGAGNIRVTGVELVK